MILVVGVFANLCFVVGGCFRKPTHTMMCVILGNLSYILYYFLLGLHTPIINVSIGIIACLVAIIARDNNVIKVSSGFLAMVISIMIIANMQHSIDCFLIVAAWAIAFAQMNKDNYVAYKLFVMVSQCLWIVFCLVNNDFAMLATCFLNIASHSTSLWRNMARDGTVKNMKAYFNIGQRRTKGLAID